MQKSESFQEYTAAFPAETQQLLSVMREAILSQADDITEHIAYGMPAYKTYGKPLVYFAAFKNHIGFYATPTGHSAFEEELSQYKQGKGSVQFPLNAPLPLSLVKRIVQFRLAENKKKYGR